MMEPDRIDGEAAPTRLLTRTEVADLIGIHPMTVHKWHEAGRLPRAVLIGERARRWRADELQAWIDSRERCNVGAS